MNGVCLKPYVDTVFVLDTWLTWGAVWPPMDYVTIWFAFVQLAASHGMFIKNIPKANM